MQATLRPTGLILISIFMLVAGCEREENNPLSGISQKENTTLSVESLLKSYSPADIVVHNGESIQAAVNAASAGAVIHIEPGVYAEAVAVSKSGIKLIGLSNPGGTGVIIQNPGEEENGITVTDNGDGFALVNVTVRDFEENGVLLDGVDSFLISHVQVIDNGDYGIFPVHSTHGVV